MTAKQPLELHVLKGNRSHLTKAEIEERKRLEIKAPSDKVKAPKYLGKELKKEFNKIAKTLLELKIMSNLDCDALARFLIAQSQYVRISQELSKIDLYESDGISVNENYERLTNLNDKYFKQARSAASDLGLTITSRCKLTLPQVPKKDEDKRTDEEKMFGGSL